jgi:hypothetical protein
MTNVEYVDRHNQFVVARRLDAAGWGLFFVWVGFALIANLGWGVALLGVGVITLGGQLARKQFGVRFEPFWVAVGFLFAVSGVWEIFNFRIRLIPIVLIIAGAALLLSAMRKTSA